MNIAEILKKCPKGTKLYSPLFGEVHLQRVDEANVIHVKKNNISVKYFNEDGKYYLDYEGSECLLFPYKDQRDWSKFAIPREDLKEGTPCVCFDSELTNAVNINIRYYKSNSYTYSCGLKTYEKGAISWDYIIPVDKFNFKDLTFKEEDNYGTAYNEK